ncbi:unnamed protein product [Somion occarium]|uniref:Dynamin-type G domain-containing protein n=2 Tax=Somion occarium TaxID=3059160 RepID=A0ABP1E264_9APHY
MAQSYFPSSSRVASPLPVQMPQSEDIHSKMEDVQEKYLEQKERLLGAIDSAKTILSDLRIFNRDSWVVRYPQLRDQSAEESTPVEVSTSKAPKRKTRKGMARSMTLASIADETAEEQSNEEDEDRLVAPSDAADFHVFRLDLKLGSHGSSSSPAALVSQLEKASIANLLDDRIGASMNHINKLRQRVEDKSSKVLVTGDLNAGKSTFVNALLKREVMPVDQQPCTTAFCEVHDAADNDGKEELHILKEGIPYSREDESTYTRADLSELESIVSENENVQQMLKVYLRDARSPTESLLSNGIVDISLIDAPGLNRDSMKTTAVFARQEEIDVVVFVVSAENHFTLSAKEFLWNASNEKAYLFIVVNKYEQIRDKAKCRRLVLEQIKQLSPRTFEDAEDLVHFVDSASAFQKDSQSFENLESSLRSFVLVKRAKSKLTPASTYLTHLLSDVDLLVGANAIVAETELERALEDLNRSRPVLEKMKNGREALDESLEHVEEAGSSRSRMRTKEILNDALVRVGQGKLGVEVSGLNMPSYPGFLGIWEYAREVRKTLLTSVDIAVKLAEDEARKITSTGVDKVFQLGEDHLPEGVERSRRVFMPEAMFSTDKLARKKARRQSGALLAGGVYTLGISLGQRPDMLETTFFDIFDVQHQFRIHFSDKSSEEEDPSLTALSVASVGLGALTMVGGKALGVRGVIEGIVRLTDLLGNQTARKWAAPVLGALTIGAAVYFVLELPSSIPRTVGRRIQATLVKENEERVEDASFVEAHAGRVGRESRKVLRLASWDLRERFRNAMEERGREVRGAEDMERKARKAVEWFREVEQRAGGVRCAVESIAEA